jgi:glutamate carboxypeptidase
MRVWTALAAATLLCVIQAAPRAQPAGDGNPPVLTPLEHRIADAVDARSPQALALLEEVVNINSGTLNQAGVAAVGRRFRTEFDRLGFTTRWIDGAPFNRAGHLVAEHPGRGPHLLLIGHLDTVFDRENPFQRFERLSPSAARGPGIIDMKGGDVVIVEALSALQAVGALAPLHISVILTGDEEDVGEPRDVARAALRSLAQAADAAIGFEDGSGHPTEAIIARRGFTGWQLTVTATPAHSSQIFREGVGAGAIFEASRVLHSFYDQLSGEPLLTFNPGLIAGGTSVALEHDETHATVAGKTNVIAGRVVATGDLRSISSEQLAAAKQAMTRIAASALPGASSALTFTDSYPPMAPRPANSQLLDVYDRGSQALGTGQVHATDPRNAGAADISFAAAYTPMTIDGIGLMGTDDHTDRETADLATLPSQSKRAAIFILRLSSLIPSRF